MTDGEALLKAILASPEEDTPRLMYADWLDEQGNEIDSDRAEFIRVQCEIAALFVPLSRVEPGFLHIGADGMGFPGRVIAEYKLPLLKQLQARERELLDRVVGPNGARQWSQWVVDGLGQLLPGNCGNIFTRGFIESVRCPWEFWKDRSDVILKRHPIEKVTLTTQAYTDSGFPLSPDMLSTANGWEKIVFEYSEHVSRLPPWRPTRATNLSMGDV